MICAKTKRHSKLGIRFFALGFVFVVFALFFFFIGYVVSYSKCCLYSMKALKQRVLDDIHTLYMYSVQFVFQIHFIVLSIFIKCRCISSENELLLPYLPGAFRLIGIIRGWHGNQCSLLLIMTFHLKISLDFPLEFRVPPNSFP